MPHGWASDGVIARVSKPEMVKRLKNLHLPVVNVSGIELAGCDFPRVVNDLQRSGKMAAAYFLERGYQHFAYFSLTGLQYVTSHREAFAKALKDSARPCPVFSVRPQHGAEPAWNPNLPKLVAWLKALPKPVAMLTWNATCSRQILYACQAAGLMVPEDVSILSGTNDRLLCEFSDVPISGIQVASEQIGHRAAALLHQLIKGRNRLPLSITIPPMGVITRRSTDTLAIGDGVLLKAMSFIQAQAAQPIQVNDVVLHAGVSRRLLEIKFKEFLNRSPASEIRRAHFERARELLISTDLPIPDVASAAGFCSPEYMAGGFKTRFKKTPLQYRKTMRSR